VHCRKAPGSFLLGECKQGGVGENASKRSPADPVREMPAASTSQPLSWPAFSTKLSQHRPHRHMPIALEGAADSTPGPQPISSICHGRSPGYCAVKASDVPGLQIVDRACLHESPSGAFLLKYIRSAEPLCQLHFALCHSSQVFQTFFIYPFNKLIHKPLFQGSSYRP